MKAAVLNWLPGDLDAFVSAVDLSVVLPKGEILVPDILSRVPKLSTHT